MPLGDRNDPYRAYNFLVEIDGITRAAFQECSGLDSTSDPVQYREGGDPPTVRKLPGLVTYGNITLRRGVTDDRELWEWRNGVAEGHVERKNGSIILLDEGGSERLRWNFREGWPSKWTGPGFNATSNEAAVETLEISHESVTRAS